MKKRLASHEWWKSLQVSGAHQSRRRAVPSHSLQRLERSVRNMPNRLRNLNGGGQRSIQCHEEALSVNQWKQTFLDGREENTETRRMSFLCRPSTGLVERQQSFCGRQFHMCELLFHPPGDVRGVFFKQCPVVIPTISAVSINLATPAV